ncbi:MAG TPA: N-acetyltransferase, partial [Candidatus Melainabacteria bacterium]|nr:N-acetyltransferase [Candidatus Melainabacteria bacterium]
MEAAAQRSQIVLTMNSVVIKPFNAEHQDAVERLVLPIQQVEFGVEITREEQPDLMDIAGTFQHGDGNFWVAMDRDDVVGTIGVVDIGSQQVALKKMFVSSSHRGTGIAQSLMNTAIEWCESKSRRSCSEEPNRAYNEFRGHQTVQRRTSRRCR